MRTFRPPSASRVLLLLLLFVFACGGAEPDSIDRETFVATYVDLRRAAIQNPGTQITPAQRDEVLARHAVSEEDLLGFVEMHGRNVDYMSAVWGEVEARLHPQDSVPAMQP